MKSYISVFRIQLINSMQYRTVVLAAIVTRFFWGFMEVLAYLVLYRTSNAAFPMELSQTVSYMWMQQILFVLFAVVFSDEDIYSAIGDGSIAYELVRPMNLYGRWFCKSAANRISFTMLNCLPALLLALLLPKPFRISLSIHPGQLLLFLISAILALGVVVAFAMLMYISLFYILHQRGVKIIVTAITTFLSGGVIPLPFFPEPIYHIVRMLPFAAMQNMPLLIFSEKITGMEALKGIAFQLFWFLALYLLGQITMKQALKKVIVQGG